MTSTYYTTDASWIWGVESEILGMGAQHRNDTWGCRRMETHSGLPELSWLDIELKSLCLLDWVKQSGLSQRCFFEIFFLRWFLRAMCLYLYLERKELRSYCCKENPEGLACCYRQHADPPHARSKDAQMPSFSQIKNLLQQGQHLRWHNTTHLIGAFLARRSLAHERNVVVYTLWFIFCLLCFLKTFNICIWGSNVGLISLTNRGRRRRQTAWRACAHFFCLSH